MATSREDLGSHLSEMPTRPPPPQQTGGALVSQDGPDTLVDLNPQDAPAFEAPEMDRDWHANLADQMSPSQRTALAQKMIEYIDIDKQVREHHFERMKVGLELLGIRDIPDSDTPFDGAASVTDPLIGEAVVNFQSRAIEELMPADGPVKAKVLGERTEEKTAQGDRLADYMNYQLTEEDEGYYWDVDQMLFYLPLSGSAFKKVYPDAVSGMTTGRYVTAEDFIVPYYAKTLKDASRYAHEFKMQGNDIKRAQSDGFYLTDAQLLPAPILMQDKNVSFNRDDIPDVADDRVARSHADDSVYKLYEVHIDQKMPFDDPEAKGAGKIHCPYIITVEEESKEILAVRRNWRKGDDKYQKRIWFIHYKFLPGLGFYGFGYLHIIGSLAQATSGALRAILDTAALANLPGGFKSKKAKVSGEMRFTLGEFRDVDMSPEDLQQAFLPLPVKEPSAGLARTYQNLLARGKEFAGTVEVLTGGADNRGPVGTTLALIEQASKPQSAIHKRLHKAMREELKAMAALNYELMEEDRYPYEIGGEEQEVLRSDFDGRVDIVPVSDPNIFSNVQRIAQSQGLLELVQQFTQQFGESGERVALKRMMTALKIPDIDELLPEQEPKNLDPVTENQFMLTGSPVQVMYTQDDESHIAVHTNFFEGFQAANPELGEQVLPVFMAHKMDHEANMYRKQIEQQLGFELPPADINSPDEGTEDLPPELEQMISQAVAAMLRQQEAEAGGPPKSPEQAEADAIEAKKDAETIQLLERSRELHREKMRQQREDFVVGQQQELHAFVAEEVRKDDESDRQIERDDKEAEAKREAARKQAATDRKAKLLVAGVRGQSSHRESAARPPKAKKKTNGS